MPTRGVDCFMIIKDFRLPDTCIFICEQTFGSGDASHHANVSPAQLATAERQRRLAAEAECHREAVAAAAMENELVATLSMIEDNTFEQQLAAATSL
eukprot:SAG31_NODE_3413_length_4303_cov_1.471694_4_plen_97_part_00